MDISRPCQPEKLIPLQPWPGFDPSFSGHKDRRAIISEWTWLRLRPLSHRGWLQGLSEIRNFCVTNVCLGVWNRKSGSLAVNIMYIHGHTSKLIVVLQKMYSSVVVLLHLDVVNYTIYRIANSDPNQYLGYAHDVSWIKEIKY